MKYLCLIVAAAVMSALAACAQKQSKENIDSMQKKKVLVAYFSATGNTARAARNIADRCRADLIEIAPVQPYSAADLDWNNSSSRSSVEMRDTISRPAIKEIKTDPWKYDVIFIGYPLWWDLAPRVVNTFIESCDLNGKTVVPFATSGGSDIAPSEAALHKAYPEIKWGKGQLANGLSPDSIDAWINSIIR